MSRLLMISGDRSLLAGKKGAFWYTLQEFRKHWQRIDVICPKGMQSGEWESENGQVRIFDNVFFHPSPWSLLWQSSWIAKKGAELIRAYGHTVMTVHSYPPFYNDRGAARLHAKTGIPYMSEIHHIVGHPAAASLQEWVGYWMSRLLLRSVASSASKVRVVNNELHALLPQWGIPAEKIELLSSFYLDAKKLIPDPTIPKSYDCVFCARLVANKGLQEVLRAAGMLPGVKILVIGDGPIRRSCEALARELGIDDRVTFAGWLAENADVYRAMQSAKVFVMNSKSEGGPRVLLEAMALGLPVLSTRVGEALTAIRDGVTGMYTTGDPHDLAAKLRLLLADESLRTTLGERAQVVRNVFSRELQIHAYARALLDIARPDRS